MSAPQQQAEPTVFRITAPTGWPRRATPTDLVPIWAGEFRDHQDWVNNATARLTGAWNEIGIKVTAICVDTLGRRCFVGHDFDRARREGTFPVRYFFECQPPAPPEPPAPLTEEQRLERMLTLAAELDALALEQLPIETERFAMHMQTYQGQARTDDTTASLTEALRAHDFRETLGRTRGTIQRLSTIINARKDPE